MTGPNRKRVQCSNSVATSYENNYHVFRRMQSKADRLPLGKKYVAKYTLGVLIVIRDNDEFLCGAIYILSHIIAVLPVAERNPLGHVSIDITHARPLYRTVVGG